MSAWQELVIEGPEAACRAFVAGFAAGRGVKAQGVFGHDCGLAHESFGERLRALVAGGSHHAFFAPTELATPLASALAGRGAAVGLRLEQRRTVKTMSFGFRIEVFSHAVAAAIRRDVLRKLPTAVRVEELNEVEEENPSAHGTELYAPVHAYIYRASGRFVGQPPGILAIRERVARRDCVTIGGLHVDGRSR
jgi:hypothetical protein